MFVTLCLLYLFFYLLTILSIFFSLISFYNPAVLTKFSLNELIIFSRKYGKPNLGIMLPLFILTGIPPAILFLIKFNILSLLLLKVNILIMSLVFLSFLLNMFFYTQAFIFKNYLESNLKNYLYLKRGQSSATTLYKVESVFKIHYTYTYIISLSVISLIFYSDICINFYVHNKAVYQIYR